MEDWEERREAGEAIIRQFDAWLRKRNVILFNHSPVEIFNWYMSGYTDRRLEETTPADLKIFLYDFYIRRANPRLNPLASLELFFMFLDERGRVKHMDKLLSLLRDTDKYRRRMETYPPLSLTESRWQKARYEWGLQMNDELAPDIVPETDVSSLSITGDYATILRYVGKGGLKLTPANGYIQLRDVKELHESLVRPKRLSRRSAPAARRRKQALNEADYPYLYYLDNFARATGHLSVRKGKLFLSRRGRYYLSLNRQARYLRLFNTFWYEFNWSFMVGSILMEILQKCQPDLECVLRDYFDKDRVTVESFIEDVYRELDLGKSYGIDWEWYVNAGKKGILEVIVTWLENFGVISCYRGQSGRRGSHSGDVEWFCFTELGRRVANYFFSWRI